MNATTVRSLLLSVALGGLFGASLLHPPSARADSADFLDEMHQMGFYHDGGDAHLLDSGYAVCRAMSVGATGNMVANAIYVNTGWDISWQDSIDFVVSAVENLCPEYDHRDRPIGTRLS